MGDEPKKDQELSDLFVDPLAGIGDEAAPMVEAEGEILLAADAILTDPPQQEESVEGILDTAMEGNAEEALSLDTAAAPAASLNPTEISETPEANSVAPEPEGSPGAAGDPQCRFYSVQVRGVRDAAQLNAVKELLLRYPSASADEGALERLAESGGYRWTLLGEFQAYALMLHFFKLGLDCQLGFHWGDAEQSPTSDQALPIFDQAQASEVESTGAGPVPLPSKPGEILLSTFDSIPGHHATQAKGIVTAHGSISRAFFRQDETETRLQLKIGELWPSSLTGPKNRRSLPRAEIDKVFQTLLGTLQREAFRRSGNAVVGIRISGFAESESLNPDADQIRLIATGTAVLLASNSS